MSKKKLVFIGSHDKSIPPLIKERDSLRLDNMVMDDALLLPPSNEAFKRKLIDHGKGPIGEWKAKSISEVEVSSKVPVQAKVAGSPYKEI